MKVILLHGDDSEKSYQRLATFVGEAKKRNWEVVYLDESQLNLKENLSSGSLFGNTRFFIHRNVKKLSKSDLTFLAKNISDFEGNLILYSDTLIGSSLKKELPKGIKIEEFKLPVIVWKFLDLIYPGNTKEVLMTLHKILESDPAEKVMGLLAWHLKDLYWVKTDQGSFEGNTWRIGKLKTQAAKFKPGQLENLIEGLAEIDVKSKTSAVELSNLLDLVFIEKLE